MQIEKIKNAPNSLFSEKVRIKETGDIIQIMKMSSWSNANNIRKISATEYIDLKTGEVLEFNKAENRSESKKSLKITFEKIRDIINSNVNSVSQEQYRWLTFTYREDMKDPKKLYKDLEKMRKKVRYKFGQFEYISIVEPTGRGVWHSHEIWIFPRKAPFIENNYLAHAWGQGFVTVKKLKNCDNVGAYLTAYLGDIPLDEFNDKMDFKSLEELQDAIKGCTVKEIEIDGQKKKFIKGGRLHMYPSGFNILRTSRGIKKPDIYYTTQKKATKKVGSAKPTFSTAYTISEDNFTKTISKEYYNLSRKI